MAGDYYIYAQAASLAIATIDAEMVVSAAARLKYCQPAYIGEKIVARSKVGTHKGNKYVVSVHSKIGEREIFVGRFVVAAIDEPQYRKSGGREMLIALDAMGGDHAPEEPCKAAIQACRQDPELSVALARRQRKDKADNRERRTPRSARGSASSTRTRS